MNKAKTRDKDPVLNDQITIVIKQLPIIFLINIPLVLLLSWAYWPWVNHFWLILWGSAMMVVMVLRFVALIYWGPKLVQRLTEKNQQRILVFNSAVSGILWAWAGILFFVEGKLEYQLIILTVLIAKGAGSGSSIINSLPAFYAYFPISMLPISILFLSQSGIASILLGLIALFFTAMMIFFARNLNRTILESIQMRYENTFLLKETEERKQEAEKANAAKTQFLAAASHDLRQPIHAMSLLLNVLEDGTHKDIPQDVVKKMRGTVDSLQNLLNSLLDISRLDAGAVSVDKQSVSYQSLIGKMKGEFEVLAEKKNISFLCSNDDFILYTDPILLEQTLRNLISNAIRFTQMGSVTVEAKALDNEAVTLSVKDTGIGISQKEQGDIFDEFYQVGNQQRDRNHGLGLGLSIVKRILVLLGSEIKLQSSSKGSTFSFDIELSDQEQVSHPYAQNQLVIEKEKKLNMIICILEDDEQVSDAMQELLQSWGCQTVVATCSKELIQQLNQLNKIPDIIISDLQLANRVNGIDESRVIREEYNFDIPTLIITGNIEAEQLDNVKQAGLPILYKPVAPARLRAFLRSVSSRTSN